MANVVAGWRKSFICDDGYVADAAGYLSLINGGRWEVEALPLPNRSLADLPDGEDCVVFYSAHPETGWADGHFVVANRGGVVFNPLDRSANVERGEPVSWRRVRRAGDAGRAG